MTPCPAGGSRSQTSLSDALQRSVGAWAAFFLALGVLDKHNMKGALVGGGVGAFLIVVVAIVALMREARNL